MWWKLQSLHCIISKVNPMYCFISPTLFLKLEIFLSHCCTLRTLLFVCTPTMHSCSLSSFPKHSQNNCFLVASVLLLSQIQQNFINANKAWEGWQSKHDYHVLRSVQRGFQNLIHRDYFFSFEILYEICVKNGLFEVRQHGLGFYSLSTQLSDFILYLHL